MNDQMHFEFDEYVKIKHDIILDSQGSNDRVWPEKDIKILDDFCKKHNIVGFNCGKMNPIAALALLKQKLGISDTSLQERTPYSNVMNKRILLNG
jgi:hypothetical protein